MIQLDLDEAYLRWEIAAGRTRIRHEQAHALCGLFWAMRLLIERDEAWRAGAEDPFALHTCKHNDCGFRRDA